MPNSLRRSRDVGPVPGVEEEGSKRTEEGASLETVDPAARANQLFDQMNKNLREKRKQAKLEGKSEAEIKAIKFDQNSDVYQEWVKVTSDNWIGNLDKEGKTLKAKKEAGEDVDRQLKSVETSFNKAVAAKRIGGELEREKHNVEARKSDLENKSAKLGGEIPPAMVEAISALDSEGVVLDNLTAVTDGISVGARVPESLSFIPPAPMDGLDVPPDFSIADEAYLKEKENEEIFFGNQDGGESVEVSANDKGVNLIKAAFAKELAGNKFPAHEFLFFTLLNSYVGNDENFANFLLGKEDFKKTVQEFFSAKSEKGNMVLAERLNIGFNKARSAYDTNPVISDLEEITNITEATVEAPAGQANVDGRKFKSAEEYFAEFEKFGIENLKGLEVRKDSLKKDMFIQKANLEVLQDELKQVPLSNPLNWFNPRALNKRNKLQEQIKDTQNEIDNLKKVLVHLGEGVFENTKIYTEPTLVKFNAELADQLKQLRAAKVDSKGFFDKYEEVAMALLIIATAAVTVANADRDRLQHAKKTSPKPAAVKMVSDLSIENKAPWGGVSREADSGFTTAEISKPVVAGVVEGKTSPIESHAKKQPHRGQVKMEAPVPKAEAGKITKEWLVGEIDETKKTIAGLQKLLDQIPPVTDITSLSKEEEDQQDEASLLKRSLEGEKAMLDDLQKNLTILEVSGEQPIAQYDGGKLDFSGITEKQKIPTIDDLGTGQDALRVSTVFDSQLPDRLIGANEVVKGIQQVAGASADLDVMRGHLIDANKAKQVYEQAAKNIAKSGKKVNDYTKDQVRIGLYLVNEQIKALEAKIPAKEAKTAHADAFEVLSQIIKANENRTAVRKGERGLDVRALYGEDGAVRIMEDALKLTNDSAKLKQIQKAVTKINIVLKDKDAAPGLRADAKALKGAADDLISELTTPTSPDIAWQSSPGSISPKIGQEIERGVAGAESARAGRAKIAGDRDTSLSEEK